MTPFPPMPRIRRLACLAALLLMPMVSAAQRPPAVVTGRVKAVGWPDSDSVRVGIESTDVAAWTDAGGRFRLVVPAHHFADGDSATLTAVRALAWPQRRRIPLVAGDTVELGQLKVPRAYVLPLVCENLPGRARRSVDPGERECLVERARAAKAHGRGAPP
jgi:hypothetical protein